MELSPEILEFLKYASPRLEYISEGNGMEKEAVNLVGLWNGARRAWNWGSNLFRGAKNVEQAANAAGRAANTAGQVTNAAGQAGRAAASAGQVTNAAGQAGRAAASAGQVTNAAGQAAGQAGRAAASAGQAAPSVVVPLAPAAQATVGAASQAANAAGQAVGFGQRALAAAGAVGTQAAHYGAKALTNTFLPGWLAKYPMRWINNSRIGENAVRAATEMAGAKGVPAWMLKSTNMLGKGVAAATPWVAPAATLLYTTNKNTPEDRMWMNSLFIPKMLANKFMAWPTLMWAAHTDTGKQTIRSTLHGLRGVGSWAMKNMPAVAKPLAEGAQSIYNHIYDNMRDGTLRKLVKSAPYGPAIRAMETTGRSQIVDTVASSGGVNMDTMTTALEGVGKSLRKGENVLNKMDRYEQIGRDLKASGLTQEKFEKGVTALQEGKVNSEEAKALVDVLNKNIHNKNTVAGAYMNDSNTAGGKVMPFINAGIDASKAGLTPGVGQAAWKDLQAGNINSDAVKKFMTGADKLSTDPNSFVGKVTADPNSAGGKLRENIKRQVSDLRNAGVTSNVVQDAVQGAREGNYNNAAARQIVTAANNVANDSNSAVGAYINDPNSLGGRYGKPTLTALNDAYNAGLRPSELRNAGRDLVNGQLNTEATRDTSRRLLNMVEDPNSATGQRIQDTGLWRRFGQPTVTAGREAVGAGVTLPQVVSAVRDLKAKNYNTDSTRGVGGGLLNLVEDQNGVIGQNARKYKLVNEGVLPTISAGRELVNAGVTPGAVRNVVQDVRNKNLNTEATRGVARSLVNLAGDPNSTIGQRVQNTKLWKNVGQPTVEELRNANEAGLNLPTVMRLGRDIRGRKFNAGDVLQVGKGVVNLADNRNSLVGRKVRNSSVGNQVMSLLDAARTTDVNVLTPENLQAALQDAREGNFRTPNTLRVASGAGRLLLNPRSAVSQLARNPHISKRIAPTLNAVNEANQLGLTPGSVLGTTRDLFGGNFNTGNTRQAGRSLAMWALDPNSILGRNIRKNKVINKGLNTGGQILRTGRDKVFPYMHRAEDFYDQMQQEIQDRGAAAAQMPLGVR